MLKLFYPIFQVAYINYYNYYNYYICNKHVFVVIANSLRQLVCYR